MTPDQTERVIEAIADAVRDAELTLDELTQAIIDRAGPWAGEPVMEAFQGFWPRWRQAEDLASNRGVLCFGPNRGNKVTYTHPERWLPDLRPVGGEKALRELLKRYLYAYSPSIPDEFAQWMAAPPRWAKTLFDSHAAELEQVEFEGTISWVVAGDAAPPQCPPQGVRLLPYFDAYSYSTHPRKLLYPPRAVERGLAGNFQVLLIDGMVGGLWHQRRSGRNLDLTVEPLEPLTSAQHEELEQQVGRIGHFLEAVPRLTIGKVAVGAHA
jgi:hypothetical protein